MPLKTRATIRGKSKKIRLDIRVTREDLQILDDYCERKGVKRPQGVAPILQAAYKRK